MKGSESTQTLRWRRDWSLWCGDTLIRARSGSHWSAADVTNDVTAAGRVLETRDSFMSHKVSITAGRTFSCGLSSELLWRFRASNSLMRRFNAPLPMDCRKEIKGSVWKLVFIKLISRKCFYWIIRSSEEHQDSFYNDRLCSGLFTFNFSVLT